MTGRSPQAGPGCQPTASAAKEASSLSGIPNAIEAHRSAYSKLCRVAGDLGPDAPETEAAYRAMKAAARVVFNHYRAIGEQRFGRV